MEVVTLPQWLRNLRKTKITDRVLEDPRSQSDTIFGMNMQSAFTAIGGGQADFTKPCGNLSTEDLAILYSYLNQLGHLEELIAAFSQLFSDGSPENPVVVDLGSGPFTGGLALASALGGNFRFDYIGVDRASCMRKFGEYLASSEEVPGNVTRQWIADIAEVTWESPPDWRDVIVIVSYLFASPTLDAENLFADLERLLNRLGNGRVMLLYTNATAEKHNSRYLRFRTKLIQSDFTCQVEDHGEVLVERAGGSQLRKLRYALFYRPPRRGLRLGE